MKMTRTIVVFLCVLVVAACASTAGSPTVQQLRAADAKSVIGRIVTRREIPAQPKYSVNEDYTRAMTGALGMLIAQMRGTPMHYDYWVKGEDGTQYSFYSMDEFFKDDCIRIYIPKEWEGKRSWLLGEVVAEKSEGCR